VVTEELLPELSDDTVSVELLDDELLLSLLPLIVPSADVTTASELVA
jgi:hypothetical protein